MIRPGTWFGQPTGRPGLRRFTDEELTSTNVDVLVSALDWVARRYETTLAGESVRDADECLTHAANLVADYRRDKERHDA